MNEATAPAPLDPARPYRQLGLALAKLRGRAQISADRLARQLKCSVGAVVHVERGERLPTQERLSRWTEEIGAAAELPTLLLLQQAEIDQACAAGLRKMRRVMVSRIDPRTRVVG